jgi:dolichol-phosphate mannosyltransferase
MPHNNLPSSYPPVDSAAAQQKSQSGSSARLALAIPTLREAENIPPLLKRVRAALDPTGIEYEIFVVDDDSRDGTDQIVNRIAKEDPRVHLLVRKGQRGLSGAILYGWEHTDADILGVMDADLQHPPEILPALVNSILAGHDLAIGSRYTKGARMKDWNPVRKLISFLAVVATWPVQHPGLRAHDPMTGFFLVRRSAIEGIEFQRFGFKLLLEILVRARLGSIEEIPFDFGLRAWGTSKANFNVARDYARLLVSLYSARFGSKRTDK